ncbi:MBL fold metallo-hydrolase [Candidatus Acetothermia bacterium]|nr:MBL fold metallo-hydrolase [Candidatus Acetothermia bacterium]MBI3643194.1 MBL fold metallo-hydrolase [Candidatus Acetothermia bacterium]
MKVCLLASGSSGNCTYVTAGETGVLIDAGIPLSRISEELSEIGSDLSTINAILVSHEHTDHTKELIRVAYRTECPVYLSRRTANKMPELLQYHLIPKTFQIQECFQIGDLTIEPFPVFHDAVEPCGFLITGPSHCHEDKVSFGIATDLGAVTPPLIETLKRCHALALESNHDVEMLMNGHYPWDLKQRIRSPIGHLSNNEAAKLLLQLVEHGNLQKAVLAHISQHNNRPDLALETANSYLNGLFDCDLHLSYHDKRSEVLLF